VFLVGVLYAADAVHSTGGHRWFVIIAIFVFTLTYASTWANGRKDVRQRDPTGTDWVYVQMPWRLAQGLNFVSRILRDEHRQ